MIGPTPGTVRNRRSLSFRSGSRSSELTSAYSRYAASGEINSTVDDQVAKMMAVKDTFGTRSGVEIDELDGLTVQLPGGAWFNLRPSNTEPLLRLNVEAADEATMERVRDDVLALVRGEAR